MRLVAFLNVGWLTACLCPQRFSRKTVCRTTKPLSLAIRRRTCRFRSTVRDRFFGRDTD